MDAKFVQSEGQSGSVKQPLANKVQGSSLVKAEIHFSTFTAKPDAEFVNEWRASPPRFQFHDAPPHPLRNLGGIF